MAKKTHINVTVDFTRWGQPTYDLRIPLHQTVRALILNLANTLNLERPNGSTCAIKAVNKGILLSDDDKLTDHHIADGDVLQIL
ncbi:YukD family protein [Listeria floridensis FSL S10-1187]|uniref:YukD family protein n=1 Tax=Listeria floridensis FSL S10-1187 TaxID=1265817 RepID=A0ABN0RJ10_9LIST|nr:EsaB/YukD family protein [Listeria floridensis]EUJ33944.1 YukD family protein [Listeria floridensis FSL S10-1187]